MDVQVRPEHEEGENLSEVQRSGGFDLQSVFLLRKYRQIGNDSSLHNEQAMKWLLAIDDLLLLHSNILGTIYISTKCQVFFATITIYIVNLTTNLVKSITDIDVYFYLKYLVSKQST